MRRKKISPAVIKTIKNRDARIYDYDKSHNDKETTETKEEPTFPLTFLVPRFVYKYKEKKSIVGAELICQPSPIAQLVRVPH